MASQKRKPKRFRIEMGWGGLFSLAVGSFIMLLWMFVLGFWAGNRLLGPITVEGGGAKASAPVAPPARVAQALPLRPSAPVTKLPTETIPPSPAATPAPEGGGSRPVTAKPAAPAPSQPVSSAKPVAAAKKGQGGGAAAPSRPSPSTEPGPKLPSLTPQKTWFSLRVASLRQKSSAEKEARRWRRKGYKAFVRRADLGKKGVWYRVYVGHYSTIQEAKRVSEKIPGIQFITPFNE